ncbi:DUF4112 domain-containing protein [Phocaeicola vulgatus]|uniref:DUF4112 domain-containing protein n=1 Tax=Phocaeicola vulgatus TaxID=821 RepID=UPI001E2917E8|nr:DUF4112 domain-containing protein [Phocaeicola vulgatus]
MMTNEKQEIIRNSASYKLVHAIALWMDRRLLDPLIGLVLPGFGDALTSVFAVPYLYLSIVKLKSIPLTLAIVCNILLDVLIGIIPYIGVVGDVFKRAFTRNAALIKGYVEGDKAIMQEIDRKAVGMAFLIVILCGLIYAMVLAAVKIVKLAGSFF